MLWEKECVTASAHPAEGKGLLLSSVGGAWPQKSSSSRGREPSRARAAPPGPAAQALPSPGENKPDNGTSGKGRALLIPARACLSLALGLSQGVVAIWNPLGCFKR